jgi:hypothetical protein
VHCNPWLDSTLEEEGGGLAAYYPAGFKSIFSVRGDIEIRRVVSHTKMEEVSASRRAAASREPNSDSNLNLNSPQYNDMVQSLQDVLCKTTDESVGRKTPLWRVTLIPAPDDDDDETSTTEACYAVVVSANHSLMDGHGYYRLYVVARCARE